MADIRINSLPTTASASSSDDFLALDGATNGTRKLNAFSPTFGGNLTVSGTATIGSSADVKLSRGPSGSGNLAVTAATDGYCEITARGAAGNLRIFSAYTGGNFNWYWGADASAQTGSNAGSNFVLVAGSDTGSSLGNYLTVNRATAATTLAGNLTVSGTALDLTNSNNGQTGLTVTNSNGGTSTYTKLGTWNGTVGVNLVTWGSAYTGRANESWLYTNGLHPLKFGTDSTAWMTLTSTGNFLVGTGTDSGNGKLQLATHTTSAGGIGFGTDTSLYRTSAGVLGLSGAVNAAIELYGSAAGIKAITMFEAGTIAAQVSCVSGSFQLKTGSSPTTALTLDSSQRSQFEGKVTINGANSVLVVKGANPTSSASSTIVDWASNARIISYGSTVGTAAGFNFVGLSSDGSVGGTRFTIDSAGDATFAGNVTVAASKVFTHNGQNGYALALSTTADRAFKFEGSASGNDYTTSFTNAGAGKHNLSCSGAIAIGNTVQTAAGVSSTHKVTISIGGSTYYLLATNV